VRRRRDLSFAALVRQQPGQDFLTDGLLFGGQRSYFLKALDFGDSRGWAAFSGPETLPIQLALVLQAGFADINIA
jgi:hypothetical protein